MSYSSWDICKELRREMIEIETEKEIEIVIEIEVVIIEIGRRRESNAGM